jgi:hypothetical protein
MIIGGVNEDWPVETRREMMFDDFENNWW